MTGASEKGCGPVIIKLGGAAVDDPAAAAPLLRAIATLHQQLAAGVVVVHGGGKAIDERLARLNMPVARAAGLRITPPEQMEEVAAVLSGIVRSRIVAAMSACGARAVGISLADGGLTTAQRLLLPGVDLGSVGEITGGDARLCITLLREGFLPIISPIAIGAGGELLNVNADDAAAAVAGLLHARLLVLLTDVAGVRDRGGAIIPALRADEAERLIHEGVIHSGMIPKVRSALAAASRSGVPTLIASWTDPARLESLSTGGLPGTLVLPAQSAEVGPLISGVVR